MTKEIDFPQRSTYNERSANRPISGSPVFERFDVALGENPDARAALISVISNFTCAEFTAKGLDGDAPLRYASDSAVLQRVNQWNANLDKSKPTAAYVICCEDGIKQPVVGISSFITSPSSNLVSRTVRRLLPENERRLFTGWFNADTLKIATGDSEDEFAYKSLRTSLDVARTARIKELDVLVTQEGPEDGSKLAVIEHSLDVGDLKKLGFKKKADITVPIEGKKYEGELLRLSFN